MSLPIEWLPGESLYSFISRMHRLTGHTRSANTSSLLFGSSRAGGTATVTTSLDELARRTQGVLGTAEELATTRQTAGYFLKFLPDADRTSILHALKGSISPSNARALLRTKHPSNLLRWCPACRAKDLGTFGVAYWRLNHQLPCAWACLQHRCRLQEEVVEGCTSWLSRWVLPDLFPQVQEDPADERIVCAAKYSADIQAATSLQLPHTLDDWFQSDLLPDIVRQSFELLSQGSHTGQVSESVSYRRWKYFRVDCDSLPLLMSVCGLSLESLREPKLLASELKKFNRNERTEQQVLDLARAGTSASRAARLAGVDTKTAQIWIGKAIRQPPRRPKKLRGEVLKTTVELLRSGADKSVVAKAVNLSDGSINTLLGIEPGLHQEWKQRQVNRRTEDARLRITRLLESGIGLSAKAIRVLEPSAYALLYRRDRLWLLEMTSTLPGPIKIEGHQVSDRAVAESLDALKIIPTNSESIHAADILKAIPSLAAELRYLLHMPQTIKSLQFLMRRLNSTQVELF